jgi:glutathione synthase/RimK-type ligase-like ATP-grasp enzyme
MDMLELTPQSRSHNPRLGLIGNPENRRIRDFQDAAAALGYPRPHCLAYEDLLRSPESLAQFDADLLRIDSPGENENVARALISLGGGPAHSKLAFGEIGYLKEYHLGFCQVMSWIERRGIPCLNSPQEICVMFDKWACHQVFAKQGVKRPPAELAPSDFPTLLAQMRIQGNGKLFLKPLHGSSASGVCALRWTPQRQQLIAPFRIQAKDNRPILINSLDVCNYTSLVDIELILGLLLPQGMISEQWIPKLTLPGGAIDLRVLVIADEARHWVIRQSQHPMTNLHLGTQRGDETALREIIGPDRLESAFRLAEQAARCFPNSLYAGVDILLDTRHRALVGEINAFGDLLPRLIHRGESAYTAIARALHFKHGISPLRKSPWSAVAERSGNTAFSARNGNM